MYISKLDSHSFIFEPHNYGPVHFGEMFVTASLFQAIFLVFI